MKNQFFELQKTKDSTLCKALKINPVCKSFTIELTARCNNNCSHCYINLPANDYFAKVRELTCPQILDIADQAVNLGALLCYITGGEPLLRPDFADIYLGLKKKGLLVSIMTNATLINEDHIALFHRYPPHDIEITVYGVTKKTYEAISRIPGSFEEFMSGLSLLMDAGIKVKLKAMAIRSNLHEFQNIAEFSRLCTKDYYRFDTQLHLRNDHDPLRNEEIRKERLTPKEIVILEQSDCNRINVLNKLYKKEINIPNNITGCNHLFSCRLGHEDFVVSPEGLLKLCACLCHPDCVYDLKKGSLADAWPILIKKVRDLRSDNKDFLTTCRICPIISLCNWCPARAYSETGKLDGKCDYFCQVAHARAAILRQNNGTK